MDLCNHYIEKTNDCQVVGITDISRDHVRNQ